MPAASNLPTLPLSERVSSIPEALSIYINQLVYDLKRRGQDIVTLSLGEAFFDIPLFDFRKLDITKGYHYSDSQGIPELREKIAEFYEKEYGAPVAPSEIMITAGSKAAIFMCMQVTCNPGDIVLIHEPAWLSYQEQARLVGATPEFIPFDCAINDFTRYYKPNTRLLIINNPNNPAGRVYSPDELRTIYQQCRSRGIYLLVDEAYSDFELDDEFVSIAEIVPDKDGVILVNSLSKNMGMSGWRVGYVITGPSLLTPLIKVNQHLITCAPTILLHYLAKYFDQITSITLPQVRAVVEKRQRIAKMMDQLSLKRLGGGATFYFFVAIENFPGSSYEFAIWLLLHKGISVVPGSAYGESTERFVRVSIGTESEERIWQALVTLKDLIVSKTFNSAGLGDKLRTLGFDHFVPAR